MMSAYALGKVQVRRSGYGAMQLAGPFAFGTPPDRASAVRVLQAAVSAGVDHIDTAEYYGPGMVNDLIREALYPYPDGLAIVSKVAVSGAGRASDHQDQLRAGIEDNLRRLRVGQLAAVNLRMPGDGRVDARFDDQLAAMTAARDDGLIAGIGLSNVSLGQLKHAVAGTEIACVQNMFHLADRSGAPVLQECLRRGIAFVPFCPLGWPRGRDNPVLGSPVVARAAARLGATQAQVALRWLLQLAPNVLLIPGTGSVTHLRDNLSAEDVRLDDEALRQLDGVAQVHARLLPHLAGRPVLAVPALAVGGLQGHGCGRAWPCGRGGEQVAGREAAVGPPALRDGAHLVRAGQPVELVSDLDGLAQGEVTGQDDVLAAERDDHRALNGPRPDAGDLGQRGDQLVVRQGAKRFGVEPSVGQPLGEVAQRGDLPPGQPGLAQVARVDLEQLAGRRQAAAEQLPDPRDRPPGDRDGQLLAGDLEQQRAE